MFGEMLNVLLVCIVFEHVTRHVKRTVKIICCTVHYPVLRTAQSDIPASLVVQPNTISTFLGNIQLCYN